MLIGKTLARDCLPETVILLEQKAQPGSFIDIVKCIQVIYFAKACLQGQL